MRHCDYRYRPHGYPSRIIDGQHGYRSISALDHLYNAPERVRNVLLAAMSPWWAYAVSMTGESYRSSHSAL